MSPSAATSSADGGDAPERRRRPTGPIASIAALLVVAVIGGSVVFLSGFALGARVSTTPGTPADQAELWAPFWDAYRAITDQFVGEVDERRLVEGAIDGMVTSLDDRWSQYLTAQEYRDSLQGISGRFSGIGAEMQGQPAPGGEPCTPLGPGCRLTVISTVPGAPAEKAGLLPGDAVIAVDGESLDGLTADDATGRIRGQKGTPVTLTIVRGAEPARDLTIVRDYIARPEVQSKVLADGTVGYVKLSGFSDSASKAFAAAVADLAGQGITRYVVDVRGNPGGFVSAARDVASQFVASGPIYFQEDARGDRIAVEAKPGGAATGDAVRVALLIDGNSASASEIVAGALQDTGRATLVGSRSFGKGTIQEWLPLPNDMGGMRLTVLRWLTPDGRWIHDTGVEPDVAVDAGAAAGEASATGDAVLDRALEVVAGSTP
ncbi:MAG: S41 family peptidase [Chloroflexi bacterium]|nr:S41 family peptidase [Chloroflexota bacterium]